MATKPITINRFLGVDKRNQFSLSPEYAMSTSNLTSDKFPALTTRPGLSILGAAIGTKILGMGAWKDTELHAVFNDGTWRKWNGSAWSVALASGLSTTAECTFTNFKGGLAAINLFMSNGVDTLRRYDGAIVSTVAGAPAGINYVTMFADRLFGAVANELKASAYRVGTDWTTVTVPEDPTDSWYTFIETADGETINGIQAGLNLLTITKPSAIFHLYGYDPTDYQVRLKTPDYGAFNNKCMVPLNGKLYMIDPNAISNYEGGVLPDKRFSEPVQEYVDDINQTGKLTSCVGSDGLKLYVSIPVTSTTNPDTILVYDPKYGTWFVWEGITALHFIKVGSKFYIGDAAGKVHQVTGTTDNGTAIAGEWITPPITAPSMAQVIRWLTSWVTAYVPTGSVLSVYISPLDSGDTDWTLVKTFTVNTAPSSESIYLDAQAKATNAKYLRFKFTISGPVDIYEWTRIEEYEPIK